MCNFRTVNCCLVLESWPLRALQLDMPDWQVPSAQFLIFFLSAFLFCCTLFADLICSYMCLSLDHLKQLLITVIILNVLKNTPVFWNCHNSYADTQQRQCLIENLAIFFFFPYYPLFFSLFPPIPIDFIATAQARDTLVLKVNIFLEVWASETEDEYISSWPSVLVCYKT